MRTRTISLAGLLATLIGAGAQAGTTCVGNICTITGTDFDVVYDTTKEQLFGAPTLVGDNLFFTPNGFIANSTNGSGVTAVSSTINGLILVAHPGFSFGTLSLTEIGDYAMTGANSSVSVGGELIAFDQAHATSTFTTDNILVSGSTPLNLHDGVNRNWIASAGISNLTPPVLGGNPWLPGAAQVGLQIENRLTAYTQAGDTGLLNALIEKKFNGVEVMVTSAVPLPAGIVLLPSGLALLAASRRRRREQLPRREPGNA